MEISFGVSESSLPVLEEEGLGSHLWKLSLQGSREKAHLPGQNQGLRV